MIEFTQKCKECERCSLREQARHPGILTRAADFLTADQAPRKNALLVVGQCPGFDEDLVGSSWVGPSGRLLHGALKLAGLNETADCYLSNTCRCYLPAGLTLSSGQMNSCSEWLHSDIGTLYDRYDGNLTVLCCGAAATKTLLGKSLGQAVNQQAILAVPHYPNARKYASTSQCTQPVRIFSTYHPAFILAHDHSALYAFRDHLSLVRDNIQGFRSFSEAIQAPLFHKSLPHTPGLVWPKMLSLDIETYGALEGQDQTVFHPMKSQIIDQIPTSKIVQTVAIAWLDPTTSQEVVTVYNYQDSRSRQNLYSFFRAIPPGTTILGQNIPFDIMMLRHVDGVLRRCLSPGRFQLADVILWNFLHSESRPERSLKSVAKLFALAEYGNSDHFQAKSAADYNLQSYNALDACVSIRAYNLLQEAILRDYGSSSAKLSPACHQHCSNLLWTVIHMGEAGITYSLPKLQAIHQHLSEKTSEIAGDILHRFGIPVSGPGSATHIQSLVNNATLLSRMESSPQLRRTEKTKAISTAKENLQLLRDHLPVDSPVREQLARILEHKEIAHMVSSFTNPLLNNPTKGIVHRSKSGKVGFCYPSWYVCPSKFGDDDSEKEGGTIQARITCRNPAAQTHPLNIKATRCSRWPGGVLLEADYSQVELRVAALLSGDPLMLREYELDVDRHRQTGILIHNIVHPNTPLYSMMFPGPSGEVTENLLSDDMRQVGKTVNFLAIYEGKAKKLQSTLQSMANLELSLRDCESIVKELNDRYPGLVEWRKKTIDQVARTGYLELPTGWSRSYPGGRAILNSHDEATIVNFPIQATAGQFLQQAQWLLIQAFQKHRLRSVMPMQTYDSIIVDIPQGELSYVQKLLAEILPHPPLLEELQNRLGRTIPLLYKAKLLE